MNTEILYRYVQGLCSTEELQEVKRRLETDTAFQAELDLIRMIDTNSQSFEYPKTNKTKAWEQIQPQKTSKTRLLQPWIKVAAAVLVLFTAVLTYQKIQPDAELLSYQAVQEYQMFDLPDGSKVWLTEGSKLTYQEKSSSQIRHTILDGVGFFVVKPNNNKNFEVTNGHLKVVVLGTSFEVLPNQVNVLNGQVQVNNPNSDQEVLLESNETANLENGKLTKSNKSIEEPGMWRSSLLKFKNESLSDIASTLENHYQIKVIFDEELLVKKYTCNFEGLDLEEVVSVIAELTQTKVKISDREYRFKM